MIKDISIMMEYIVMPTAIIKLKINKTGGHQSFSGGLPHFPITPSPFPPFSSVPSEKVFFYCLPIGRPFTGTHSPTIYRAFLISFHLISSHFISSLLFLFVSSLSSLGANWHSSVQLQLYPTP